MSEENTDKKSEEIPVLDLIDRLKVYIKKHFYIYLAVFLSGCFAGSVISIAFLSRIDKSWNKQVKISVFEIGIDITPYGEGTTPKTLKEKVEVENIPANGEMFIEGFDSKNNNSFNELGGRWAAYDDHADGGTSESSFSIASGGAVSSHECGLLKGKLTNKVEGAYLGVKMTLQNHSEPMDLSHYKGLSFWAKGDGRKYKVIFVSKVSGENTDFPFYTFRAPKDNWVQEEIKFDNTNMNQEGYGEFISWGLAKKHVTDILWQVGSDENVGKVELRIDSIKLF
jgi:hypothetical protein